MKGAVIASTQAAVEGGHNRLVTGALSTSDIENWANPSAESSGISLSTDMVTQGRYGALKGAISNSLNSGSARDSSGGKTQSAISMGTLTIKDEEKQRELTGKSSEDIIAAMKRDVVTTHTAARKLDIGRLEEQAKATQVIKNELASQIIEVTDAVYRADNAPRRIVLAQKCATEGECKPMDVDLENHTLTHSPDGKLYVFNNGIFNDEKQAVANAIKQHGDVAYEQGIYAVINPYTGGKVSEIVYAGLDKLREITGLTGLLGVSNASEANTQLRDLAEKYNQLVATGEVPVTVVEVDHSRGSLTSSIATARQMSNGQTNVPVGEVQFNGAAANAERMAERVRQVTGDRGVVSQSTHKNDFVGAVIGGNQKTGGADSSFGNAHSSYGPGATQKERIDLWENSSGSKSITISPRERWEGL